MIILSAKIWKGGSVILVNGILFFVLVGYLLEPAFLLAAMKERGLQKDQTHKGFNIVSIKIKDNKPVTLYQKSYALMIGVSEYKNGWPRLYGVKDDIREVTSILEKHGFQVTVVKNPDNDALRKAYVDFINKHGMAVQNRLLFYFAGHGHTEKLTYGEDMGYIVPVDAPDPEIDKMDFLKKALDMQQMEVYARRIQSKHALFVFDSCFSGSIFSLSRSIPKAINLKTTKPVRQFITSGRANETVPDKSIFRHQFVDALEGEGDLNSDGYITGEELGLFLETNVTNYSKNTQHPQYGKIRNPHLDKGDFVFETLALNEAVIEGQVEADHESLSPKDDDNGLSSNGIKQIAAISSAVIFGLLTTNSINQSTALTEKGEDLQKDYNNAVSQTERDSILVDYNETKNEISASNSQAITFFALSLIFVGIEAYLYFSNDSDSFTDISDDNSWIPEYAILPLLNDKSGQIRLQWKF